MSSLNPANEGYTIQYTNEFGGIVYLHDSHNKNERNANLVIAVYLANLWNIAIYLMPVSGEPEAQNPDALLRGERWEFKTNYAATGTSIDTAIKRAAKQAPNILLHLTKLMAINELENAMLRRVRQCEQVEKLAILLLNKLYVFSRATIMNKSFRGQMAKEKGA